jgi:hypothetical protein
LNGCFYVFIDTTRALYGYLQMKQYPTTTTTRINFNLNLPIRYPKEKFSSKRTAMIRKLAAYHWQICHLHLLQLSNNSNKQSYLFWILIIRIRCDIEPKLISCLGNELINDISNTVNYEPTPYNHCTLAK